MGEIFYICFKTLYKWSRLIENLQDMGQELWKIFLAYKFINVNLSRLLRIYLWKYSCEGNKRGELIIVGGGRIEFQEKFLGENPKTVG